VGFADLDRSAPGSGRSLTMTVCGLAIVVPRVLFSRVIRRSGHSVIGTPKPLNYTPIEAESLKSTPIWDDLG
jgi:hypothetical protein